jgi:hypothetical protein
MLSGAEENPPTEKPNKALPALMLLNSLLGDRYVFHEEAHTTTWNENELEASSKRKVVLPMSDTV